jgi:hypothetical protein
VGDSRLAEAAMLLLLVGGLLSVAELLALGHLTAPVLALDTIGGTLLPYGLLMMCLELTAVHDRSAQADDDDTEDGGWGRGGDDGPLPLPPGGGLRVDWQRFEADFRAYAESLTAAPAGALGSQAA